MENLSLTELRELKTALLRRAYELRDQLQNHEKKTPGQATSIQCLIKNFSEDPSTDFEQFTAIQKDTSKLCDVSQSILGVQFKDVTKNWIRNNTYFYEARVMTKALKFAIDLTVDVEENEFTIQDINCHFADLDRCYLEEIASWVERFARAKQFSYLISGISGYSDQSVLRTKILHTLESEDYITMGKCLNPGGGILIHVHPPGDQKRIFFEFQWSLNFVDRSWRVEHIFAIDPIQADETFVIANKELLEGFCRVGVSKDDLEDLWNRLCTVIDDVTKEKE